MANAEEPSALLAVLIDADNASPAVIEPLLAEVAKIGVANVKRIYGDWTRPDLAGWKAVLLKHSIHPMQQFRNTNGKNATDSAMIIDAMDLLYTGPYTGFCLVSSDSDFTRLASRLREAGKRVYGFGERKTPSAFVSACDRFIYTEGLTSAAESGQKSQRIDDALIDLFRKGIEAASDDSGWAHLGGVGSVMNKQAPDFDPRNYGYPRLSDLAEAIGGLKVDRREKGVFIREERRT